MYLQVVSRVPKLSEPKNRCKKTCRQGAINWKTWTEPYIAGKRHVRRWFQHRNLCSVASLPVARSPVNEQFSGRLTTETSNFQPSRSPPTRRDTLVYPVTLTLYIRSFLNPIPLAEGWTCPPYITGQLRDSNLLRWISRVVSYFQGHAVRVQWNRRSFSLRVEAEKGWVSTTGACLRWVIGGRGMRVCFERIENTVGGR